LLFSTPWIESLRTLGYPYGIKANTYTRLAATLEFLRIPGTSQILEPIPQEFTRDPWIPHSRPIFKPDDPSLYPEEKDYFRNSIRETSTVSQAPDGEISVESDRLATLRMPSTNTLTQQQGSPRLTLREQLERFGLPRPEPTPTPAIPYEDRPNPDAGWTRPPNMSIPTALGSLYLLAAKENSGTKAAEAWEEFFWLDYQHPYAFLYYRNLPITNPKETISRRVIQYPESNFTLYSLDSFRGSFVTASQISLETIVSPTLSISHESFVLEEEETEWRWFHDIAHKPTLEPVSAETAIASGTDIASVSEIASVSAAIVISAPTATQSARTSIVAATPLLTPLLTSLYSVWSTQSPAGETFVVRKGRGGVGGTYTLFAHKPNPDPTSPAVQNVIFSLANNAEAKMDASLEDRFSITPEVAKMIQEPANLTEWQSLRRAERMGTIKPIRVGVLHAFFSPNALDNTVPLGGAIGPIFQARLSNPRDPFYYITALEIKGHEMYEAKYANIPLPGMRFLEWKQGIELIAFNPGQKTKNPFIDTDADLAIVARDRSMKGLFYLMINGSYLRIKFSPTQNDYVLLVDSKGKKVSCVWADRKMYLDRPPQSMSVFYAPSVIGFECPKNMIKYGAKGRQAVVWNHEPTE